MTDDIGEQRVHLLPLRSRRTLGRNAEVSIASTLYCPVQERSVAVAECEGCESFHSLHFEPTSRITSVRCRGETAATDPAEETARLDTRGGPLDPKTPLADVMTKEVVCVRSDIDVQQVKDLLMEREISGVPVVDEQGKPVGVISRADVLRLDSDQGDTIEMERVTAKPKDSDDLGLGSGFHLYEPTRVTVTDIMCPIVFALHESSSVGQAAALMAFEGIHQLPIISDRGEVVGILSALDVLRWFGRRSGYVIP